MHAESYSLMAHFAEKYLNRSDRLKVLDVGSQDINGSYKPIFKYWDYTGLDIAKGKNVDVVAKGHYDWGLKKTYNVIISGNCLEHVENPFEWVRELERYCEKGTLVCIITPMSIDEHRYPVDCWRILPDGYRYLMKNFEVMECYINRTGHDRSIKDTICIAIK